jgi:hypothetical protein
MLKPSFPHIAKENAVEITTLSRPELHSSLFYIIALGNTQAQALQNCQFAFRHFAHLPKIKCMTKPTPLKFRWLVLIFITCSKAHANDKITI